LAETAASAGRLPTGVPRLDGLLGGGLLRGRSLLLKGPPGSGKTTLGMQMLVAGATSYGEPGLLLTFEQVPEQLYEDAAGFGWDLPELARQNRLQVFFIQPREVLEHPGRHETRLLARIEDWVAETGARRILVDSISHLRPLYTGEDARAMFMNFILRLKQMGLTPVMTAELTVEDGLRDFDVYLADAVFELSFAPGAAHQPDRRELRIAKTRGHDHVPGAHPYDIGPEGIVIYPHDPVSIAGPSAAPTAPRSSGVVGLDLLLGGGYSPGSTVLAAGLSGTFKTTLAGHFLTAAADRGEGALWIHFLEESAELTRAMEGRGLAVGRAREAGRLFLRRHPPGAHPVERILHEAEQTIRDNGVSAVVVDGLDELTLTLAEGERRHEAALWFAERLRAVGATALFTQRLERVTGRNPLSEIAMAELADTIVYLGLVEIESRLEKVISVLKHRRGAAVEDLRSIQCTPHGLNVSDRFVGLSGVLAGAPLGRRKAQIENIFQPLYFVRDFLGVAQDPGLDPAQRAEVLNSLSDQTGKLIELLGQYFDEPTVGGPPPAPAKESRA